VAVVVQVEQLVAPLGDDAQRVFEEGDDDEEAADGGEVAVAVSTRNPTAGSTNGLSGSETVSRKSSILLVCSRMASSGLGSFVASLVPGPPKGCCAPMW
jgi:hypothetical protein